MASNLVLVALIALLAGAVVMATMKKRRYLVFTADGKKLLLYRKVWEWEVSGTAVFRDEQNRRVIISKHWMLKIVEITKEDWYLEEKKLEVSSAE